MDFARGYPQAERGFESQLQAICLQREVGSCVSIVFQDAALRVLRQVGLSDLSAPQDGPLRHDLGSGKKRTEPIAFSGRLVA